MSSTPLVKSLKSIWRENYPHLWSFYCPLCKLPRRLPFHPKPGSLVHGVQIGLTSVMFTVICWNWLGWKGVFSFFPFWTLFEFVYRWRMRGLLPCPKCGFDPYLFLMDEDKAKSEIESHWRKKFAERGIPFPEKAPSGRISP